MTYKEAKKQDVETYINFVFKHAKTDEGMTALDTARFHTYNPNGNYKLCQGWGYEAAEKGHFVIGLFAGDYNKKELEKLTDMKNPRWWNVNYHVNKLYEEAVSWAEKVKDVESRTDEEKEYIKKLLEKK